jgi:PAS domain S-box-containing protein
MPESRDIERTSGWPRTNILIVDDTPAKLLTLEAALAELGQTLLKAHSVEEALAILLKTDVALIVTDVYMPGAGGFDLAKMVRDHPRFARIPIMFVSAEERAGVDHLRAYASGAADYVRIPVAPELLRAKVKIFIDLFAKERELARLKNELEARVERRTKRLAESEKRYRSLVDNANDIVATLDLELRFTSVNPAIERVLGYLPDEVVGTRLAKYVPEEQLPMHAAMLKQKLEGQGATTYEMQIFGKDREQTATLEVNSRLMFDEGGRPAGVHAIARDVTERKEAEARQLVLIRELQHRTRNLLAVVQSIVSNTLDRSGSEADAKEAILGRLHALARAQEFVASGPGGGVPLRELVDAELSGFTNQVSVHGVPIILGGAFAQQFALVLHELATNAAKHGALSVPNGRLVVRWSVERRDEPMLLFSWEERGGPRVQAPTKQGFGSTVIATLTERFPQFSFGEDGFTLKLEVPISDLMTAPSN